jgi:hypothetical protein
MQPDWLKHQFAAQTTAEREALRKCKLISHWFLRLGLIT